MPKAVKGVLVQCDPAIRAIILKLDESSHEYIVDDLDEQTLVIKESKLGDLKAKLDVALADSQQVDGGESDTD